MSPEPQSMRPESDELEPVTVPQRREIRWSYPALLVLATVGFLPILLIVLDVDFVTPLVVAFELMVGWVWFIIRQLPPYLPDASQALASGFALALLVCGLHAVARRIFRTTGGWRWPRTAATLLGAGMLLAVGIAFAGIGGNSYALSKVRLGNIENLHGEPMRRSQSKNNLKQIGLAEFNYESTFHRFPAGGTFDALGQPMHSWATSLLPFLDQAPLYNHIRRDLPWTAPENRADFQTPVPALTMPRPGNRPGFTAEHYATADYAGNGLVMGPHPGLTFPEFTDGSSNTIIAGEVVANPRAWGDPLNWRDPGLGINTSPESFGSPWQRGGCHMLFADGSVHFLSQKTDPAVLRKFATPNGGERITNDDLPRPRIQ